MSLLGPSQKKEMEKAIEHLRSEYSKLRVGRASTGMVEDVKIDAYGSLMGIKELAVLSTPDAKTIMIQPWDKGLINEIEKSILAANLGLTPINDGKMIRINLPAMTEERRREFVKEIKRLAEDSKVALRNVRRDLIDEFKKDKESSKMSEDELRRKQEEVQQLTDHFVKEIDKIMETKSKEVLSL